MLKKSLLTLAVLSSVAILGCKPADAAKEKSVMEGLPSQETASTSQDANAKAAEDFLAKNKSAPGVTTTASGLQYAVIASGPATGLEPSAESVVQVNYEGTLLNGEVFDSSFKRGEAAEFPVGQLIPAWVEALQMMRPGDEWTIWVPPAIGYGAQGGGPIPPNSLLIFRMKLEKVVSGPGAE